MPADNSRLRLSNHRNTIGYRPVRCRAVLFGKKPPDLLAGSYKL